MGQKWGGKELKLNTFGAVGNENINFTSEIISPFSGMLSYTKLWFLGISMSKLNLAKYAQCFGSF